MIDREKHIVMDMEDKVIAVKDIPNQQMQLDH
jgi:hypothetical protein